MVTLSTLMVEALGEGIDDLLDEDLGSGGARRDAEAADGPEQAPVDILGPQQQPDEGAPFPLGHLPQALGIRRVGRPDDDHGIDRRSHPLHGTLAVRRGVADVFLVGTGDGREADSEGVHHVPGIVDRQGRLGDEGEVLRVGRREALHVRHRLHEGRRPVRQLAHRADHLRMARMTDQHDVPATPVVKLGLPMHLRDQGAGGVDREDVAGRRGLRNGFGHPMGGEDDGRAGVGHLVELADEHRTLPAQALDHVLVVDDLVADVDRRPVDRQGLLDGIDGPDHTGAEAARGAEQNVEGRFGHDARDVARAPPSCQAGATLIRDAPGTSPRPRDRAAFDRIQLLRKMLS